MNILFSIDHFSKIVRCCSDTTSKNNSDENDVKTLFSFFLFICDFASRRSKSIKKNNILDSIILNCEREY